MNNWKIIFIDKENDFIRVLKQGDKKSMQRYYDEVYPEHRHVYKLITEQQFKELFWEF